MSSTHGDSLLKVSAGEKIYLLEYFGDLGHGAALNWILWSVQWTTNWRTSVITLTSLEVVELIICTSAKLSVCNVILWFAKVHSPDTHGCDNGEKLFQVYILIGPDFRPNTIKPLTTKDCPIANRARCISVQMKDFCWKPLVTNMNAFPLKCCRNRRHALKSAFAWALIRMWWCDFLTPIVKLIKLRRKACPGTTTLQAKLRIPIIDWSFFQSYFSLPTNVRQDEDPSGFFRVQEGFRGYCKVFEIGSDAFYHPLPEGK